MEAIIIILLIYFLLYVICILRLIVGFGRVENFSIADIAPQTAFTIVIPFRNEAKNLPRLLESITKLNYPHSLFEVILIDDESKDNGQSLVYRWRMQNGSIHATLLENIRRTGSPKKDAISRAIPIATGNWIASTDADCDLPEDWLRSLDQFIQHTKCRMVAGPVRYHKAKGLVGMFQMDDLLAMQGATMGGFGLGKAFMCNGANFAYEKKLFHELGGFSGNDDRPGGDDVFLLHKAVAAGEGVGYLRSSVAIVTTIAQKSWKSLFWQRVRWASKASAYQSDFAEDVSLAVLFGNASLVVLFILGALQKIDNLYFAVAFLVKFLLDWVVMIRANRFLKQSKVVLPILSSVIYPVFNVVVAVFALRGKFRWKGREWK